LVQVHDAFILGLLHEIASCCRLPAILPCKMSDEDRGLRRRASGNFSDPPSPHRRRREEEAEPVPEDPEAASEISHFLEVCWSLMKYRDDALQDVARFQAVMSTLDAHDRALWNLDIPSWIKAVHVRVEANAEFLRLLPIPQVCGAVMNRRVAMAVWNPPERHRVAGRNSSKVRSTLRQFVRDWAVEGAPERALVYTPLIEALTRQLPLQEGHKRPRVLCPGSGLGRLPFDLACMGYAAQGNEFSYHMILGSYLMFNRTECAESFTIYPYVLNTTNRRGCWENLREIKVPDVTPSEVMPSGAEFSFASGEFVHVYERQLKEWDAVITCFFLDTAKNVFLYIRTIASILRPGGVWINMGPLLYHYADIGDEISIELSWEEIRPFICRYFDIKEENRREANYTKNATALMRTLFTCIVFTAVRNEEPVIGVSKPVY